MSHRISRVKALFLVNPRSGRNRAFDAAEVIRRASPFAHEIAPCGERHELDAIVDRAEVEGIDVVYAVGGDGTVHEVAKRLIGRRPALGVLPAGSGNGFARHIGLPSAPAAALRACRGGRIATIDTATVDGLPFIGVMGLGFDALIAERFAASGARGMRTYVHVGLRSLTGYRAEEYEIVAGGETAQHRAFVIAVANSGQYGNNARIAPLASLQDGLLDVVVVRQTSLLDAPLLLARLFSGSVHRSRRVTSFQTAALTIRRAAAGPAHLDGEPVTLPATLDVRVVPASLNVLVPDAVARF